MNPIFKLAIPVGLGLAAGLLNYMALENRVKPQTAALVVVTSDLKAGQPFSEDNLGKVELAGSDLGQLPKVAVPYENRAVLLRRPAPRDFKKGDLILWRDTTPPPVELRLRPGEQAIWISLGGIADVPEELIQVDDQITFVLARTSRPAANGKPPTETQTVVDTVGPFRVLGVGERLERRGDGTDSRPSRTANRAVAVAVQPESGGRLNEATQRLILADRSATSSTASTGDRIVQVLLRPASARARENTN